MAGLSLARRHLAALDDPGESVARGLDRLLNDLAARRNVPHAVMAVERGDGSFRWAGARGRAWPDGPPMRPDTPIFIASVTKLYIATAVMKLVEAGHFGLESRIVELLPGSLVDGLHRLDGQDHTSAITVRHLLSHSSGLADGLEDRPRGGRSLVERLVEDGDMAWSIPDLLRIVRDDLTPHFPPQPMTARRVRIRYSDTNYQLLIALLEQVTASRYHEALEEMLLRPLALDQTWVSGHPRPTAPDARPAALQAGMQPLDLPLALSSSGDLVSTVYDTIRFQRALVEGRVFDDPATYGRMQERWNRFRLPTDAAALRAPSWPIEYGLGIKRFQLPRAMTPFRPVPAVVGHTGSTGSWLFHCPDLDLFLAGTVDQMEAGAVPFRLLPRVLRTAAALPIA